MERGSHATREARAFNDAVLAIVMTIIVLESEVPDTLTSQTLMGMWRDVLAYAISFFWLGAMWTNQHNFWHMINRVTTPTILCDLVMLFFSSFFPLTTHMVADNFWNPLAQVTYGVVDPAGDRGKRRAVCAVAGGQRPGGRSAPGHLGQHAQHGL